jgi:hypothetical protein
MRFPDWVLLLIWTLWAVFVPGERVIEAACGGYCNLRQFDNGANVLEPGVVCAK